MKLTLLSIISSVCFSFFFIHSPLFAQDTVPGDSIKFPLDTTVIDVIAPGLSLPDSLTVEASPATIEPQEPIVPPKLFSGIELGIDYLKFAGLLLDFETKYEGFLGLIFREKIVMSFEAGTANLTPKRAFKNINLEKGGYISTGRYSRVGVNYIFSSDEKNNISAGVRYGYSIFNESIDYKIISPFGFETEGNFNRNNRAHWYEIIVATETAIRKNIFAGAAFRFRILGKIKEKEPFEAHSIPGYGRGFDKTIPVINLYFKYRLNF